MSLKKNIAYSGILTVSLYILQFITFPYVSRSLGVASLGLYNYYNGLAIFFTVMSSLGIPALGIREIAKVRNEKKNILDQTFSCLFFLNSIYTLASIAIFLIISFLLVRSAEEWILVGLCVVQILFNLFIVEWFFRGLEDFKYIAIRTLSVRILFVVFTFILIKEPSDYILYFVLGTLTIVLNALINWFYKNTYVTIIKIRFSDLRKYVNPSIALGIFYLLGTYYNTIFPFFLKHTSGEIEVGYFTSGAKLILIVLLIYNAYTQAMIPRISSLSTDNEYGAKMLINRSFEILFIFAIPLIILLVLLSSDIVAVFLGKGYEGAIIPMIVSAPVILIGGIDQIISNQILLPYNRDREIVVSYFFGIVLGLFSSLFLFTNGALSFAVAWLITEISICGIQLSRIRLKYAVRVNWLYPKYIIACFPLFMLYFINNCLDYMFLRLIFDSLFVLIYSHIIYKYILKSEEYISINNAVLKIIKNIK